MFGGRAGTRAGRRSRLRRGASGSEPAQTRWRERVALPAAETAQLAVFGVDPAHARRRPGETQTDEVSALLRTRQDRLIRIEQNLADPRRRRQMKRDPLPA